LLHVLGEEASKRIKTTEKTSMCA